MDGHRMDVIVIDPDTGEWLGRPYLVAILDVCTRALVGWHISLIPFCATTALAAVKDMCSRDPSKGPGGVPEQLTPDLGPDLVAGALTNMLQKLLIHFEPTERMDPNGKAMLERFFLTLNMQLSHIFPGTTFSSPANRGEYKSEGKARLSIEEVREKFGKWADTVYHKGVHGETQRIPAVHWRECQSSYPLLSYSKADLDVMARVSHPRTISSGRVTFDYLFWKSAALSTFEQQGWRDVILLIDELNLENAYVHPIGKPEMVVQADPVKPEYMRGLTKYEHERVKKKLKEQTAKDLREVGEFTWAIARWQLYEELHGRFAKSAKRRLKALLQDAGRALRNRRIKSKDDVDGPGEMETGRKATDAATEEDGKSPNTAQPSGVTPFQSYEF
jgi:putative transposase